MTREKLIEALKLAAEIEPSASVQADHDVIYLIDASQCSDEHISAFKAIGCRYDRDSGMIAVYV